jgi:integrase
MGQIIHKLAALQLEKLTEPGLHLDGGGLYLRISTAGAKEWIFRYKQRNMGLGSFPAVLLADARKAAAEVRDLLQIGVDPIEAGKAETKSSELQTRITFDEAAKRYIAAHESGWRNPKYRQQWTNSLATYTVPIIGDLDVAEVDTVHVLDILKPIWNGKNETACRLRERIETVLDWAKVRGFRDGENPARWRGHLTNLLPSRTPPIKRKQSAILPYAELPEFMAALGKRPALAARAFELCVLAATRTNETLGATWDEFDLEKAVWTIPAERMQNRAIHRVPLSAEALAVLKKLPRLADNPHVFSGERKGQPLSSSSLLMLLRRMRREDLTTLGFRSTFRAWASECTRFPREIVELALSHTIGSAIERAYMRFEAHEKHRALMHSWAEFCKPIRAKEKVIDLPLEKFAQD